MRLGRPGALRPSATFTLAGMPEGPEGVRNTLEMMRRIVRLWRVAPLIYGLSREIIANVPGKDFAGEARAIFGFVREAVRYTQDPNEIETLQSPEITLELGHGDCDDQAMLLASLLESVGHPTRFVAIGFEPNNYEHVYVETLIGRSWVAADTTEPCEFGWAPSGISRMVRHI